MDDINTTASKLCLRDYLKLLDKKNENTEIQLDKLESIMYVPNSLRLTDAGKIFFKDALERCYTIGVSATVFYPTEDKINKKGLPKVAYLALKLLSDMQGRCSEEEYNEFFEDPIKNTDHTLDYKD